MNFLEASLEDVCKEELKQAEVTHHLYLPSLCFSPKYLSRTVTNPVSQESLNVVQFISKLCFVCLLCFSTIFQNKNKLNVFLMPLSVQEQVEAARKGLDQAKEEGLKLHASSDDDDNDFLSPPASAEPVQPTPARRGRKPKDKSKIVTSTRMSGRLRGASPETEPEPTTPREVPDRLRLGLRGRGAAKDSSSISTTQFCTDQHKTSSSNRLQDSSKSSATASSPASDHTFTKSRTLTNRSSTSPMPSPPLSSPTVGKYQSPRDMDNKNSITDREEERRESERRVSESSVESSCVVDNHTKDDDVKDHSAKSPPSRSPRKRQSADNEVLRGLVEDSPSAKVLRKLPGRLVTVVEEKEPRKRRRRGSGTGGEASTEEPFVGEDTAGLMEESNKDSVSADRKTKEAINSSKDQDSNQSLPAQLLPVRSYPPYSPPHLSPDMPVLRNLPVRRRLETESRMAAQLGEQQQHIGRGRGSSQPRKTEPLPGKDHTSSSTDSSVNTPVAPVKRKRGRPPKNPPASINSDKAVAPPTQLAKPVEEVNPPQTPKRKRGRPRSTPLPESVCSDASKTYSSPAQTLPPSPDKSLTPIGPTVTTSEGLQPAEAKEEDTKPEISAPPPNPAQTIEASDPTSTPAPALSQDFHILQSDEKSSITATSDVPVPAIDQSHASTSLVPRTVAAFPPAILAPAISESSSPPVEQKPVASTAAKTPPESTQATTAAAPAPATAPTAASSVKTVSTTVPVTAIPTVTETVLSNPNIPSSVTTTGNPLQQPSALTSAPVGAKVPSPATSPASADVSAETTSLDQALVSSSAALTGAPTVAQKAPAAGLSTASAQSTLTSVPSTGSSPQTLSTPCPTMSDASTASTSSSSAVDTTLSSPVDTKTSVTETPVETVSGTGTPAGSVFCIAPPSTPSASVTPTGQVGTVSVSTPAPDTQASACEAPSKQSPDSANVEKAIKSPHSVPTPAKESSRAASSPEKSVRGADIVTNTQLSTSKATPVSALSSVPPGSPPSGVFPEEPTPAQMDVHHHDSTCVLPEEEEEAFKPGLNKENEVGIGAEETKTPTCEEKDKSMPQSKRRVGSSSEDKEKEGDRQCVVASQGEAKQTSVEQREEQKPRIQKRPLSRQSSQESTCSSSQSSGCSTSTLTRQAHHKRTYEHRLPNKKRRIDVTSENVMDEKEEGMEDAEEGSQEECCTTPVRRRRSRSTSSSSDSDDSEGRKEHLLARPSKHRLQSQETETGSSHQGKKRTRSSERNASHNTSTAGESGSDTSSVRITRKSAGSQGSQGSKASTNSASPLPPEPEVLGKRCSALNAAAKLQAMKGRVDTPGHTLRKDPGTKAAGTSPGSSSDKNPKPKSKSLPATPQTNSLNNNKSNGSKSCTASQPSRSASRSTRQCPGSLVPPLELEYKRSKPEEKERRGRKSFGAKEGEAETHSSSRGHSACSSMSSDGEGDGGRSSRSRSSSNSSQRTHSISSQNTEHRESRAASSGSERSSTQTRKGRQRESGLDHRRSQRLSQEVSSSSGTEGTPDRVLRSVAALAAVHARSPAESTRSSSGQHRLNKT